jgi:hypothetical protein
MKVIEAKGKCIFVRYDEVYSKNTFFELMKEAYKTCKETNCYKLLVDISKMPGKVSIVDRFEFGVRGAALFRGGFKIAVVYRAEEINRFAETVSLNRGLNSRIFSDIDEALQWLSNK